MRIGDEQPARGGVGEAQADWEPPFFPDDAAGGGRGQRDDPPRAHHGAAARPPVAWYIPFAGRLLTVMALGMVCAALIFGFFGVTTTRSISSTNAVPLPTANPVVHINSAAGAVRVVPIPIADPGKADKITVDTTTEVRHLSPFLAENTLKGAEIAPVVRDGEVYIDMQRDRDGEFFFERSTTATVYVPQGATLELRVQFGAANVTGITGPMTIEISGGVLNLIDATLTGQSRLKVDGGSANLAGVMLHDDVTLTVNGGNIDLDGKLGGATKLTVAVKGGNARLHLPLGTAARIDAQADGGSLWIEDWPGAITQGSARGSNRQQSGYLSANTNTANQITLRVSGGGIKLRPQKATDLPDPPVSPPAAPPPP